jgi:glycine betaine catabolism A
MAAARPLAPIAKDELTAVLRPFGQSRMLPRQAYLDPAVFAWEAEHFLRRRWVCVGRGEDVPAPGDQRAVELSDGSVLLVRGRDGTLRGFANVCRHRGHELLPCSGSAHGRAVTCPYHSWSYGLTGELIAAPNMNEVAEFDRADFPLLGLATEEWHGYVFVNASGDAGPLADQLGSLDRLVDNFAMASLVTMARHEYVIEANWKILGENYNECYHCPSIHPELCAVSPPDSGQDFEGVGAWVGGWQEFVGDGQTMSLDGSSPGRPIEGLTRRESATVCYIAVFPNLLISLHPDYVMTHRFRPLTPGTTHVECSWAFPPSTVQLDGFDPSYAVDFWDITNRQDFRACESVQRGIAVGNWPSGPIAPVEGTLYRWDTMLANGYLGNGLVPGSNAEVEDVEFVGLS